MSKQFIGDRKAGGGRSFSNQAFNRAEGITPVTGSMTTLGSGILTLDNIFARGIDYYRELIFGPNPITNKGDDASFKTIHFQFFPEEIRDSRRQSVAEQDMLLASDMVPTLGSASKRIVSFTCVFSQERIRSTGDISTIVNSVPDIPDGKGDSSSWDKYNFDVAIAVQAIRSFAYPIKSEIAGGLSVTIQPVLLDLPGTLIGLTGDSIFGMVTSYDVSMKAFFPNGRPRLAEVGIEFTEYPSINPETKQGFFKQSFVSVIQSHNQRATQDVFALDKASGPRARKVIWASTVRSEQIPRPADESPANINQNQ